MHVIQAFLPSRPAPVAKATVHLARKRSLLPGDILLYHRDSERPTMLEQIVFYGQHVHDIGSGPGHDGDTDIVHAAIWTKDQAQLQRALSRNEIVEAQFENENAVVPTTLDFGVNTIIRAKDRDLANDAAEVAQDWAREQKIRYSTRKALTSVFFSPDGEAAELSDQELITNGAFCSEIVIGAYQKAARKRGIALPAALQVNARYTTPRVLHGILKSDIAAFQHYGDIVLPPSDAPYIPNMPAAEIVSSLAKILIATCHPLPQVRFRALHELMQQWIS